jgi:Flp pilus assembly protein TadG
LAVVLVLVQVGLLVRDHILVVHAVREAARAAAVDPTIEAAAAAAMAATELDPARLHVDIAGSRSAGSRLWIAVSYRPRLEVPIVGRLFPAVSIQEELTVRVE